MGTMMGGKARHFMTEYMNAQEEMNTEAVEYVRGIPVVKVFQQTVFSFKSFHKSIMKYRDMVSMHTRNWRNSMSTYTVLINGFAFFLVPVAILIIGHAGNLATILLDLFFYILITPVFAQSIMRNMYLSNAGGQAVESISRMEEMLSGEGLPEADSPAQPRSRDIEFREVSFSYPESANKAVDGVSFRVPEGKRYALVGASGGGKTTMARLVPRFWDVDQGSVSIGGVDVRYMAHESLMDSISFVFQNTKLFKTTLRENLLLGKPDATEVELQKALLTAQCGEIIERLPGGLDTRIGVDGTYLSGGEQQRMALARAMLKDAPIVVLDEATAFADPENEHLIQQALRELCKGKTVLMIAHRLSSVKDADRILVVEREKIAEEGRHEELLEAGGLYSNMWKEYLQSVRWTIGRKEVSHA
jgi:ATP-binding cassette subfamily B protein